MQNNIYAAAVKQKFEETMRQLFNGAEMLASYKENLKKSLTTEELKQLNEIQQHPLSQKMRDTQAHFQTPEGQQELMKSLLDQKKSPLPKQKKAALKKLGMIYKYPKI